MRLYILSVLCLVKSYGDREDKFKNLKLAYAYMCGHHSRSFYSWDRNLVSGMSGVKRALDWYLLEDESHTELKDFTKKCLKLNKNYPCLYATDYSSEGFRWINANDKDNSVLSFMRISRMERRIFSLYLILHQLKETASE